jgi:hypothetical protein
MTPKTILSLSLLAVIILLSSCSSSKTAEVAAKKRGIIPAQQVKPQNNLPITFETAQKIGQKIWMNEGAGKVENLIVWNKGENFASLGIGHFIWYPATIPTQKRFDEQFPKLVKFLKRKRVKIPSWLEKNPNCPWKSEVEFNLARSSHKKAELLELLQDTIAHQVEFIVQRLKAALPKMSRTLKTVEAQKQVRYQFNRVFKTPQGIYALVDYVNFKGEGINPNERHNGEGWGLLQVLQNMSGTDDESAIEEFIQAADKVLTRRVQNAPEGKDETKWLSGWRYRLKTYSYDL